MKQCTGTMDLPKAYVRKGIDGGSEVFILWVDDGDKDTFRRLRCMARKKKVCVRERSSKRTQETSASRSKLTGEGGMRR